MDLNARSVRAIEERYQTPGHGGHLRWASARGSDPGMSNRELSDDFVREIEAK